MLRFFMEYFSFTRSEARVSLVILMLLLTSLAFRIIVAERSLTGPVENDELLSEISLAISRIEMKSSEEYSQRSEYKQHGEIVTPEKLDPVLFDPNIADTIVMARMGIDEKIVRNIHRYREAGGRFYKKEDLLKIYGMNDALFHSLQAYILLESKKKPQEKVSYPENLISAERHLSIEINTADSALLLTINDISPFMAGRIVKFRQLLGGYFSPGQLMEVYGMDSTRYKNILALIKIDKSGIIGININKAEERMISRHPYVSFQLARDIVKYRELKGRINSLDELVTSGIMQEADYQKLVHYLVCE
jgi:competence protein ComEA